MNVPVKSKIRDFCVFYDDFVFFVEVFFIPAMYHLNMTVPNFDIILKSTLKKSQIKFRLIVSNCAKFIII